MTTQLASPSIAILVANGFEENHITAVQRTLTKDGFSYKIIAPEQGLVNGWQDNAWGHYFTVDEMISTAMGSDYDMLVLIGGERATSKLKANLHTRRIVNHFLEAGKPVAAIGTGVELLALSPKSLGMLVSAPAQSADAVATANMTKEEAAQTQDGTVLTADGSDTEAWVAGLMDTVTSFEPEMDEDAQAA